MVDLVNGCRKKTRVMGLEYKYIHMYVQLFGCKQHRFGSVHHYFMTGVLPITEHPFDVLITILTHRGE